MRFNFSIVDDDGDVLASDWTTFDLANFTDRGVEQIEIHVYSALRAIKREKERAAWKAEMDALTAPRDQDGEEFHFPAEVPFQ